MIGCCWAGTSEHNSSFMVRAVAEPLASPLDVFAVGVVGFNLAGGGPGDDGGLKFLPPR